MKDSQALDKILVLDFGAQYAHLIARRIRELGVFSELVPYGVSPQDVTSKSAKGLVLSGGPHSVYTTGAPLPDPRIYDLGLPILGICYGLQAMVYQLGGMVSRTRRREYGRATIKITRKTDLFSGVDGQTVCWMSHGDSAERLPVGFEGIATSDNSPYAAVSRRNMYAVQFHPEVTQTEQGTKILANFVFQVCGCARNWTPDVMVDESVKAIRAAVGSGDRVICALSGGVDSSTAAALLVRALGEKRVVCVFVDHGLLRKLERQRIEVAFKKQLGDGLVIVDSSDTFLAKLSGVVDPEEKRKTIGREFIRTFSTISKRMGGVKWLAQGTLYPDVVESASALFRYQSKIKSHHNVGGLPTRMNFRLIEPLRELYKDEVRKVAAELGLTRELIEAHPFPGPGLAVRIIGAVTKDKLRICRESSAIVEEELRTAGLHDKVWQSFAMVGDDVVTGVQGDGRAVGRIVTIRIVESLDGMTADWSRIPYEVLASMSSRITNEVPGVTWVTYAVSSKPPSTIEPQ